MTFGSGGRFAGAPFPQAFRDGRRGTRDAQPAGMLGLLARRVGAPIALILAATVLTTGCLGSSYTIPKDELERLARTPPLERGGGVRVVQRFGFADDPPSSREQPPIVTVGPEVAIAADVAVGVGHATHRDGRAVAVREPGDRTRNVDVRQPSGGGGESDADGDGGDGEGGDGDDAAMIALAAIVIVTSVIAASVLAATEGSRFDGYARVDSTHPIHLVGPDGEDMGWVPLAALDTGLAAAADEAILSEEEGKLLRLRRAPLDRRGFTFGLEIGGVGLNTLQRETPVGLGFDVGLGVFPIQELGLVLGAGFHGGTHDGETLTEWRIYAELQAYPLAFGPAHFGAYARGGHLFGEQADRSLDGFHWGGGALFQLDVTTRLALTLRAGLAVLTAPGAPALSPELTAGLAIY